MENEKGRDRAAVPSSCGSCRTDSVPGPATVVAPAAAEPTPTGGAGRRFDVRGLDCIEEVRILRRAVGPLVGGDQALAFDPLNGRMSVRAPASRTSDGAIVAAVAATGMSAAPAAAGPASAPPDRGPLYAPLASGVLLLVGIALHVVGLDALPSWNALVADHGAAGAPMPSGSPGSARSSPGCATSCRRPGTRSGRCART